MVYVLSRVFTKYVHRPNAYVYIYIDVVTPETLNYSIHKFTNKYIDKYIYIYVDR